MTVEELLALDGGGVEAHQTGGGGSASWRRVGRGKRDEGLVQQYTGLAQQHTGGASGRPLPPQPQRGPSGGVHAWEADEGSAGGTVRRAPPTPTDSKGTSAPGYGQTHRERAHHKHEQAQRAAEIAEAEARGRERGRRWAEENRALRSAVDAFRARLEEVERRVGRMEDAAAAAANGVATSSGGAATSTKSTAATESTAPALPLTLVQKLDPRRLIALIAPAQLARTQPEGQEEVGPNTISALPSYVLLVGIGVCAVVLRVLVRRGMGAVRRRA